MADQQSFSPFAVGSTSIRGLNIVKCSVHFGINVFVLSFIMGVEGLTIDVFGKIIFLKYLLVN
jgi:hypothetical protein